MSIDYAMIYVYTLENNSNDKKTKITEGITNYLILNTLYGAR